MSLMYSPRPTRATLTGPEPAWVVHYLKASNALLRNHLVLVVSQSFETQWVIHVNQGVAVFTRIIVLDRNITREIFRDFGAG